MNSSKKLVKTALFLAIAVVVQILGRGIPHINQLFVGSVVNAVLLMDTIICGTFWSVLLGILTPVVAFLIGQLPTPMGPFIPFIAVGNIIFVVVFGGLYRNQLIFKYSKYLSIIVSAILKSSFLSFAATKLIVVFKLNIPKKVAMKLAMVMGIPQLFTALIGGCITLILSKTLSDRKVNLD